MPRCTELTCVVTAATSPDAKTDPRLNLRGAGRDQSSWNSDPLISSVLILIPAEPPAARNDSATHTSATTRCRTPGAALLATALTRGASRSRPGTPCRLAAENRMPTTAGLASWRPRSCWWSGRLQGGACGATWARRAEERGGGGGVPGSASRPWAPSPAGSCARCRSSPPPAPGSPGPAPPPARSPPSAPAASAPGAPPSPVTPLVDSF